MEGDLNSTHLKICCPAMQTPSVGEVCEYPKEVLLMPIHYLGLELVLLPASCSIQKNSKQKNMRGVAMMVILSSHQQNAMVSTLNVLLLTLNKALPGGRPRITRFVLILIPCLNNAQSCFVLPLSILVRSSLNVCHEIHS